MKLLFTTAIFTMLLFIPSLNADHVYEDVKMPCGDSETLIKALTAHLGQEIIRAGITHKRNDNTKQPYTLYLYHNQQTDDWTLALFSPDGLTSCIPFMGNGSSSMVAK